MILLDSNSHSPHLKYAVTKYLAVLSLRAPGVICECPIIFSCSRETDIGFSESSEGTSNVFGALIDIGPNLLQRPHYYFTMDSITGTPQMAP